MNTLTRSMLACLQEEEALPPFQHHMHLLSADSLLSLSPRSLPPALIKAILLKNCFALLCVGG